MNSQLRNNIYECAFNLIKNDKLNIYITVGVVITLKRMYNDTKDNFRGKMYYLDNHTILLDQIVYGMVWPATLVNYYMPSVVCFLNSK
jgi:hypothetical protein